MQSVARAALLGARGNSGVILSQLISGAAEELVSRPGAADRRDLDRRGARQRRRSRLHLGARTGRGHDPDRGARDGPQHRGRRRPQHRGRTTGACDRAARAGPRDRRNARTRGVGRPGVGQARAGAAGGVARRGRRRRRRTRPHDHLRRGGRGAARTRSRPSSSTMRRPRSPIPSTARAPTATAPTSPSPVTICERRASARALETLGDSVLVVGDPTTLKVHLHTDEPERATALFDGVGEVSHLDVADMRAAGGRARPAPGESGRCDKRGGTGQRRGPDRRLR